MKNTKLRKIRNYEKSFDKRFFEIVKAGFANKRKQLWRNLAVGLKIVSLGEISQREKDKKIKDLLIEIVGSEKVRAEELSVEQWAMIARSLTTDH